MADACTDLSCADADTIVEEGVTKDLETVRPGDIITMPQRDGPAHEIVVVRRAFEPRVVILPNGPLDPGHR